jgi:YVTN family beta-propeller protein
MHNKGALGGIAAALTLAISGSAVADDGQGGPITPAGWKVEPAGQEIGVSKAATGFQGPLASALSPDGKLALAASSGASKWQSADLFDLGAATRSDATTYDASLGQSVFYGVTFSPDGSQAWMSGGGQDVVHHYDVADGKLKPAADIAGPGLRFPAGLAYGRVPGVGDRILVANNQDPAAPSGVANPPGHTISVIDPATNAVTQTIDLGTPLEPLGVTFDRSGRKAYVSNWIGRSVSVVDAVAGKATGQIQLSPQSDPQQADHPSAIAANAKRDEVYTANANSDTVSVIDTTTDTVAATIDVSLVRGALKGAIPDGLSVSPDGRRLYVAEAGENAVAVVDLDDREVVGFIPTSWYPSDVDVTPDGRRLVITNTNDSGAGPNPCGNLQPATPPAECTGPSAPPAETQYSGRMIKGSMQVVDVPDDGELRAGTEQVRRNNQARGRSADRPRGASQIKHVIYVVKENRTYDQVFGDLPNGNGDPRLALFKDDSAPNHRELARRYSLIDNFYADAEVSADGHNWISQAGATDYVDKTWPINYSPSVRSRQRSYDFENVPPGAVFGTEPLAQDPSIGRPAAARTVGYLWDNAFAHDVSFRDYGEYVSTTGGCQGTSTSNVTHLDTNRFPGMVDQRFIGYDLNCSDHRDRLPEWARTFDQDVKDGTLPALEIVRIGNDHTRGTTPGAATPKAYVADNDLALGRLVDKVSHSRYWRSTLILVTEDDAQNGPDHVDAHRTVALAISPWTRRGGKADSTHYDTASMVATAEDVLGLPPMGIVDARANRMWGSFADRPNDAPYDAITPSVTPFGAPGAPVNGAAAPMAAAAAKWDFSKEDRTPETALNRAIWKSVKGRQAKMPAPRHDRIIGTTPNDEADG